MTVANDPPGHDEAHAQAIDKLETAIGVQNRMKGEDEAAAGGADELSAGIGLAAANEQVAARKAWLGYVEHGS